MKSPSLFQQWKTLFAQNPVASPVTVFACVLASVLAFVLLWLELPA